SPTKDHRTAADHRATADHRGSSGRFSGLPACTPVLQHRYAATTPLPSPSVIRQPASAGFHRNTAFRRRALIDGVLATRWHDDPILYHGRMMTALHRTLRWSFTALALLAAVCLVLSRWVWIYMLPGTGSLVTLEHGVICFNQRSGKWAYSSGFKVGFGIIRPDERYWGWHYRRFGGRSQTSPDWVDAREIPLWMISAPATLFASVLWLTHLRAASRRRA